MENTSDLPDYDNPPVDEVVCGILFAELGKVCVPHFGQLWEVYRPEYSICKDVTPLLPTVERFDETPSAEVSFSEVPPLPRVWFIHSDDTKIIQVQRDRFLHNWRRGKQGVSYPRYPFVIEAFREQFTKFQSFLAASDLGEVAPIQYEMTYINQIPKGEGWSSIADLGTVFPDFCFRPQEHRFLPAPEGLNVRASYLLPGGVGRLHATIRSAVRRVDNRPIVLFELTARGIGPTNTLDAIWTWFDLAREWIVRAFTDLTSEHMHKNVWRRQR